MTVLIGYASVRKRDFFYGAFETLDADAVVDLEEVPENEGKASEQVGRELFGREREHQSSDSGTGKEGADVHADEREDEHRSEPPNEDGRRVLEERKEFLCERTRFENL